MDCRNFHRNLEDYLQSGLDFAGRFGMERHAEQCFGCGKVLADAQKLGRMARELKRVGAPPNFESLLLARIRAEGVRRRSWNSWFYLLDWPSLRTVAWSVSSLALVGLGIYFLIRFIGLSSQPSSGPFMAGDMKAQPLISANTGERIDSSAPKAAGELQAPDSGQHVTPANFVSPQSRRRYFTEEAESGLFVESADSDYVEYLVAGPGDRQFIMRLPKTIRVRYRQPSEEYFIRNVSH